MHFKTFKQRLAAFFTERSIPIFHNFSVKQDGETYAIWYELGVNRLDADGEKAEQSMRASVQFFTKIEYSELPEELESFFDSLDIAYENETYADFNQETGRYHYGWKVEFI
nr:MAG TPA: Protein of unknown function (DUF806) [Caudoviricetes sp.]